MSRYVHAVGFSGVYRFTRPAWRKFLLAAVAGDDPDPSDYGTMLCTVAADVSELDVEGAQVLLDRLARDARGPRAPSSDERLAAALQEEADEYAASLAAKPAGDER